jgi:hypothetical protein
MNEGKGKIYGCTLFAMLLATGSCNARGWNTFMEAILYFLAIGYTFGVRKG